ncbi:MAG: NADH-quinone oxidoreductase subunit L, partial [Chloroflexota bacterium]|nr:NADH-quinone oxidoreductase subunit L [Chloroflexota bacterium]
PLAGFWSKDELLGATLLAGGMGYLLYALGALASFLTAVYTFRMIFLTFFGKTRMETERFSHVHESPHVMTLPLVVLAVGAALAGFVGVPPEHGLIHNYLHDTFIAAELAGLVHKPSTTFVLGVMAVSTLIALFGILIAYSVYMRGLPAPEAVAGRVRPLHTLLVNKYFLDDFYDTVLAGGTRGVGWLFAWFDLNIVDGLVNLIGLVVSGVGGGLRRMQTGRLENYAFSVVLGTALVLAFYIIMVR